ncbi:MAG: tRNA pseudouridine(38-40) synthase TruA, partial [Desulfobacterales bacterium]
FSAFEGTGSPRSHAVRQVFRAFIDREEKAEFLAFDIEADGFLRFMVRNIVGTLVLVGSGKISVAEFEDILLSKERERAGATAPPQGLFLMCVNYE